MQGTGAGPGSISHGGWSLVEASRWFGVATARAVATLPSLSLLTLTLLTLACATPPAPAYQRSQLAALHELQSDIDAALELYESGEFTVAARHFEAASVTAHSLRAARREKDALASACMSWLRARRLRELGDCTERLETLQRMHPRSEPGVNTLIALGAIAAGRPLPSLMIPRNVRPLVQASAQGGSR